MIIIGDFLTRVFRVCDSEFRARGLTLGRGGLGCRDLMKRFFFSGVRDSIRRAMLYMRTVRATLTELGSHFGVCARGRPTGALRGGSNFCRKAASCQTNENRWNRLQNPSSPAVEAGWFQLALATLLVLTCCSGKASRRSGKVAATRVVLLGSCSGI